MPPLPTVPPDRITIARPSPRTGAEVAIVQPRVIPWARWGRLALAVLLFGIALLPLVPAQFGAMWVVALVVTETAHWFAVVSAGVAAAYGWRLGRRELAATGIAALAALLFLVPLMQALTVAHDVEAEVTRAWGRPKALTWTGTPVRAEPIVLRQLFLGMPRGDHRRQALAYPGGGDADTLDLYLPVGVDAPVPLVVMLHGGSWSSGSRRDHPALAEYLAGHGFAVAMPDYRKAPAHPYPAARDDVLAAVRWLREGADSLGLDASRVALIGRSAGAQLAFATAAGLDGDQVRGVVSLYGPLDLRWGYAHPGAERILDGRAALRAYLGGAPADTPDAYDAASPIQHVTGSSPPALLIHGSRDELVSPEHSARFAARMQWAKRPHVAIELPWASHGCDVIPSGPCDQMVTFAVERFLNSVMR